MAYLAGRIGRDPQLQNPTVIVTSSGRDLNSRTLETFERCHSILREPPERSLDRRDLHARLATRLGGIVFTTQAVLCAEATELSSRRDIMLMTLGPLRSRHKISHSYSGALRTALPNALFICFTRIPFMRWDIVSLAEYGGCTSKYDLETAVGYHSSSTV